jgi:hypothetical protein
VAPGFGDPAGGRIPILAAEFRTASADLRWQANASSAQVLVVTYLGVLAAETGAQEARAG